MAVYSARQSTYVDGDVITADDSNDEFDTILAAFHATTGHPHDGTAGGGPLLVATGALNVGSITSGFGNIDNGASNITSGGLVKLDVDADADDVTGDSATGRLTLGATEDLNLYHGGTNSYIVNDTGDLILDTAGDIVLDADGGDIFFKDATTTFGSATNTSGNLILKSGTTTALTFSGANATFAGTVTIGSAEISEAELEILDGASVTTTELNLIDGDTARGTTSLASGDGILINDAGTMRMTNVDTVSTYMASSSVGGGSIVTVGALDSGSITSGFGTINTGSSTITTTGAITGGSVVADDINLNGKVIVMTGDTDDTVTMTAAANGAFSLVTVDDAAAAGNIQITADGTVDIDSAGVLTLDSGAAINIEPASGSAILLDGTISVDAGVVTGATSITSTAFVGTLSTAAQANITSVGTLTGLTISGALIKSVTNSITAGSTQSQAGATALTTDINRVTVSGTDGDGVKLPTAVAGAKVEIINDDAAQTIQIWPATGDAIDGGSANAVDANTLAPGGDRTYFSVDATNWYTKSSDEPAASATVAGIVELATTAETTTGTDAARAVTPDGLHDMTSLSGAAWLLDEDAMGSNSDVKVASQQSIKAYVDALGVTSSGSPTFTGLTTTGHTQRSLATSLTAGTTQTMAGALALTKDINIVTVVGSDDDGVALPTAVAGKEVTIINSDAAQRLQVWPGNGFSDTIDGGSANAVDANTLAAGGIRTYVADGSTNWVTATAAASGGGLASGDIIGADDGAVSAPGLAFADDLDNGFYRIGTNNWAAATAGSKVMEFQAGGDIAITSDLVMTNGKGISFAATADSNAGLTSEVFDNYEEGEYEPTLTGSTSGNLGISAAASTLSYRVIGDMCFVFGQLTISADNSLSGYVRMTLPIAAATVTEKANNMRSFDLLIIGHGDSGLENVFHEFAEGTSLAFWQNLTDAGGNENVDESRVDAAFDIWVQFNYRI